MSVKPYTVTLEAYEIIEKEVGRASTKAGNVYLPDEWIGKKVRVVLCEPKED